MRNLMGSAMGGSDFKWAKTGDLRTEYMEDVREEEMGEHEKELLGNDLDLVDIDPQFQVWNKSKTVF